MSDSSGPADAGVRRQLNSLMLGNFVTQIIYAAAKLGIPDILAAGPRSSDQLAQETGSNHSALRTELRALAALDILSEDERGFYALRPMGELLKSFPGLRSQAILTGEEYFKSSAELIHTIKTGTPAFDHAMGGSFYEYFAKHPDTASRFNEVMAASATARYAEIPTLYDFSRVTPFVDVGGGYGGLTAIILEAYPCARAILFDAPHVIARARKFIEERGLAARCDIVEGSFFESVPAGGAAYLLSSVVCNWDDERAGKILRNCRTAMSRRGSELVLVEPAFLSEKAPSANAAILAVAGYAIQGSIVRTESEYRSILELAGFEFKSIRALAYEPYAMIHAVPR
ncbi:MAG TPA: methyltransferase [Candidatus Binataceae bacterium]